MFTENNSGFHFANEKFEFLNEKMVKEQHRRRD
jgi:hypothetical protein